MGKYDFIKTGNLLYWHDPDNGLSDGAYRVISAPENMEDDSIILISSGLRKRRFCLRNYRR